MSKPYKPGNEFYLKTNIADAAVDWEQITEEELKNVIINDTGFPFHPKYPKLTARAEAIYHAVMSGKIAGETYNNLYDTQIPIESICLDRDSVAEFIKATEKRLRTEKTLTRLKTENKGESIEQIERLLSLDEVLYLVSMAKSSMYKKINAGEFPKSSHDGPVRWRYADIARYMANNSRNVTKGTSKTTTEEADTEEDI